MPLITKTVKVTVAQCDYKLSSGKLCLKDASGSPLHMDMWGSIFDGHLCPTHLTEIDRANQPLFTAPDKARTRRASTGAAKAPATRRERRPRTLDITEKPTNGKVPASPEVREHQAAMRAWAGAKGYRVGARGRIPAAAQKAYAAAQKEAMAK